ncbi:MAG: hypothetical protein M3Y64_08255, partial [Gemmatimonadota bacterium]|nr:hypothetical protein [Gemmatimonadota bacterium]
ARRHRAVSVLPAFASAELALGLLVAQAGRESERDALAGPLLLLVCERGAEALTADTVEPVLRAIAEPALAALLALLMRDLLAPRDFSALYEPFEQAIPFATLS